MDALIMTGTARLRHFKKIFLYVRRILYDMYIVVVLNKIDLLTVVSRTNFQYLQSTLDVYTLMH